MPSTQEQLVHPLSAAINAEGCPPAYLLIDPILKEPLAEDLLAADHAQVTPIPLQHRLVTEEQCPRLIRIRTTQVRLIDAGVGIALREQADPACEAREGFGIGGWLFSDVPAALLVSHLARCMDQWAPRSPRKRYMRWADRRIMEWMWPVLSRKQQQTLLGPIQQWWLIDRTECWVRRQVAQAQKPASPPFYKVHITPRQWRHAERGRQVHAMVRAWSAFTPRLPADYLARASHAVQAARSLGLTREADILLMGANVLQVHPRLAEHPLIQQSVARAFKDGGPLAESLAAIAGPQSWEAIREALDARATRA